MTTESENLIRWLATLPAGTTICLSGEGLLYAEKNGDRIGAYFFTQ